MMNPACTIAFLALNGLTLSAQPEGRPSREAVEFFEKRIRPVLVEKCESCHGAKVQRGGLRVDSRTALLKGGDSGPALVPGEPEKSLLIKAVRHQGDLKMPPKEKDRLDGGVVANLTAWVKEGAVWPAGEAVKPTVSSVELTRKTHWSFRPVNAGPAPAVQKGAWAKTAVDRFILAKLEEKGFQPSEEADRRTLIRRLSFDLTGLPPTPEEIEEFVQDRSADAYERLVDRLLASPAYGERWGRHWLDVARYADTKGYVFQEERKYPYSYTYRDYVIRALNEDLPYDRFILEQLAADRLNLGEDRRALAAMGFLTLGRRFLNNVHDIIDDRIDVVSRGLMGLTVSCARCHDHKYDPIPTRDYYSLYGVFASSNEPGELPLLVKPDPNAPPSAFEQELRKRQAALDAFIEAELPKLRAKLRERAADYLLAVAAPNQAASDLERRMIERWKPYLTEASRRHHSVLGPWFAFAKLSQEEFAEKAKELAARVAANKERGRRINPVVARAFEGPAPGTLAEVAKRYEKLFQETETQWQQMLQKDGKASRLGDAAQEEIRQVLYGANSPANVPAGEIQRYLDRAKRNRYTSLKQRVDQWRATGVGPARAMVLVDRPNPVQPHVLVRGNPGNRGVAVPRQFLEVLAPERKPFTHGSGRLELAQAIASAENPLTARVLVNRVWMHHFGQGIVRTPGDFGTRGEPPSHPELLDWLAAELVRSGWSIKHLHREIVFSATYRQSSQASAELLAADPENVLLGRMNRRRLEFEPLRDALLAASGRLDRTMGGPGVEITKAPYPSRRTIYAFIERQNLPGVFRTFDLASPDVSTPQRHATTVPQQSLFLMNNPFLQETAQALMVRADVQGEKSEEGRIDRLHRLVYGRPAEQEEIALGLAYVREGRKEGEAESRVVWEQYAQVLLLANEFAFLD